MEYFWFVFFLFKITATNTMITKMITIVIIPTIIIAANKAVTVPPLSPGVSVSRISVGRGIIDGILDRIFDGIIEDVVGDVSVTPAVCVPADEDVSTVMTEVCVMCCDEIILLVGITLLHSSS
jgi:hypothetical protein